MFTQLFTELEQGKPLDHDLLLRRFDLAMTKKLGVVKLPPAFWVQDSKINPRADHLLQAALLLGDRERCDMAVSVLAVEIAEKNREYSLKQAVQEITEPLLAIVSKDHKIQIVELVGELYL